MKITAVIGVVLLAVTLQVAFARYMIGGRFVFDLVLVGVVFAALQWGPVAGMFAAVAAAAEGWDGADPIRDFSSLMG